MGKGKKKLAKIGDVLILEKQLKGTIWRLVEHAISGERPDPELAVTLRGSSEQLIELVESLCKDN